MKEILEPFSRILGVSFKSIFVVDIVDAKPNCVARTPLKVVREWPSKISSQFNFIPAEIQNINPQSGKSYYIGP